MRVDVWSDVVCPWCYVGKHRFQRAVERVADRVDVEVVYRAFELDPTVPAEGVPLGEYLRHKFGAAATVERVEGRVAEAGAEAGLTFHWEGVRRANTFDAHRLLAWAREEHGAARQGGLKERLFGGYFVDGRDVGDRAVLVDLARAAGLDGARADEVLSSGAYGDDVRADEQEAAAREIHAVPTFVIDGRWAIPGAQDPDTFVQILLRIAERTAG